ncbi:hypothetical protein SeMB42_g02256 [Synchytrium endobioticum]|uniref:Uncharacterized protein n=1 Tax=Synchytrium endobioticum TaxID=286115 RepID=A0A507CEV0_9FUNG|nr:hypothetical protein SeLEV6574_g06827 [Synchytrium endobioticum]TPX50371.1 hypothetical protein SeMB42_g02256 [Synchytrium endobioticum]
MSSRKAYGHAEDEDEAVLDEPQQEVLISTLKRDNADKNRNCNHALSIISLVLSFYFTIRMLYSPPPTSDVFPNLTSAISLCFIPYILHHQNGIGGRSPQLIPFSFLFSFMPLLYDYMVIRRFSNSIDWLYAAPIIMSAVCRWWISMVEHTDILLAELEKAKYGYKGA